MARAFDLFFFLVFSFSRYHPLGQNFAFVVGLTHDLDADARARQRPPVVVGQGFADAAKLDPSATAFTIQGQMIALGFDGKRHGVVHNGVHHALQSDGRDRRQAEVISTLPIVPTRREGNGNGESNFLAVLVALRLHGGDVGVRELSRPQRHVARPVALKAMFLHILGARRAAKIKTLAEAIRVFLATEVEDTRTGH